MAAGLAVAGPVSAEAAMLHPAPLDSTTNPNIVDVAVNCGPHAHYVRGHRDKNHHYIKGRCVRDHH